MAKRVIKRDGTIEVFEVEMIERVVLAAGLDKDQAAALAHEVEQEVQAKPEEDIPSLSIRDLVLSYLKKINGSAADLYAWYEQTKDDPIENS